MIAPPNRNEASPQISGNSKIEFLKDTRIGSVPYLNARPLTHAIGSSIALLPPRRLAAELHAGRLDAALVPLVEVLENPETYDIVDGVAIGSLKDVYSVILQHDVPLERIRTLALDPDSKTSVQLARVILENFHQIHPQYVLPQMINHGIQARVLIGDPALNFRQKHPEASLLDLAGEWNRLTQLPFVFAVWAIRSDTPDKTTLAKQLRHAAEIGLASRREIARSEFEYKYLTEYLHYTLGQPQKAAICLFSDHLEKLKLLPHPPRLIFI